MKLDITIDRLAEIVFCIVDCGLERDEALDYALKVALDCGDCAVVTDTILDLDGELFEVAQ